MSKKKHMEVHPVDMHVGKQLRKLRVQQKISQGDLGKSVDLTFQQIQKYERGLNRISCSKLYDFAKFLKTNIDYFFEGLKYNHHNDYYNSENVSALAFAEPTGHEYQSVGSDVQSLSRYFSQIKDPKIREHVLCIVKTIVNGKD